MASNKSHGTFCGQAPMCTLHINNANGENASEKEKKGGGKSYPEIIITKKVTIPWFGMHFFC